MREAFRDVDPETRQIAYDFLMGRNGGEMLTPVQKEIVREAIANRNRLQRSVALEVRRIRQSLPASADPAMLEMLATLIEATTGQYLKRAYRAHYEPGFAPQQEFLQPEVFKRVAESLAARHPDVVAEYVKLGRAPEEAGRALLRDMLIEHDMHSSPGTKQPPGGKKVAQAEFLKRTLDEYPDFRQLLGEIKDPVEAYEITHTALAELEQRLALMRNIAEDPEMSSPVRDDAKRHTVKMGADVDGPRRLPGQFGMLTGRYVTPEVAEAMRETIGQTIPLFKVMRKLRNMYQIPQTALSVATTAANFWSGAFYHSIAAGNSILNGMNLKYYKQALDLLLPRVKGAFVETGAKLGSESARESTLNRPGIDRLLDELVREGVMGETYIDQPEFLLEMETMVKAAEKGEPPAVWLAKNAARLTRLLVSGPSTFYNSVDAFFRVSAVLNKMDKGMSMERAIASADGVMPNYGRIPPALKNLQDIVPIVGPFLSYTFDLPRTLYNFAKERPVTLALMLISLSALDRGLFTMDEEERELYEKTRPLRPSYERGETYFPFLDAPIPTVGEDGTLSYIPLSRIMPLVALFNSAKSLSPESYFMNAPEYEALSLLMTGNSPSGRYRLPEDATALERVRAFVEIMGKAINPPQLPPFGSDWNRVQDALAGRPNRVGIEQSFSAAVRGAASGVRERQILFDASYRRIVVREAVSASKRAADYRRQLDATRVSASELMGIADDAELEAAQYAFERDNTYRPALDAGLQLSPGSVTAQSAENISYADAQLDSAVSQLRNVARKAMNRLQEEYPDEYASFVASRRGGQESGVGADARGYSALADLTR
jgi:hypothetical protein